MGASRYLSSDGRHLRRHEVNLSAFNISPSSKQIAFIPAVLLPRAITLFAAVCTIFSGKFRFKRSYEKSPSSYGWRLERFLERPSVSNPIIDSSHGYIILLAPLRYGLCDSVYGFVPIPTCVVFLRNFIRPSTVFRGIVTISIESIQRMFRRRLLAHIGQKVVKAVPSKPPVCNLDTAPAIPVKAPVIRVEASFFHRTPRVVLRLILKVPAMPIVGRFLADSNHISTSKAAKLRIPRRPMFERFFAPLTSTSNHTNNYNVSVNFCKGVAS